MNVIRSKTHYYASMAVIFIYLRARAKSFDVGVQNIKAGVKSFKAGVRNFKVGAKSLDVGVRNIKVGVKSLDAGVRNIKAGAKSLDTGVQNIKVGVKSLDVGVQNFKAGVKSFNVGVRNIKAGVINIAFTTDGVTFLAKEKSPHHYCNNDKPIAYSPTHPYPNSTDCCACRQSEYGAELLGCSYLLHLGWRGKL